MIEADDTPRAARVLISDFVSGWAASPFGSFSGPPWSATTQAEALITAAAEGLGPDYVRNGQLVRHVTAVIEPGAVIKGPAILGPRALLASNTYLRGGIFLDAGCIVGPGCEIKTTFMFAGSKVAHLSFVGDSIIGADVNIEAGAMIANYRNEMDDKRIRIVRDGEVIDTGVDKFGTLAGDGVRIGSGAVIAPGAVLDRGIRVGRLSLIDQHPSPLA